MVSEPLCIWSMPIQCSITHQDTTQRTRNMYTYTCTYLRIRYMHNIKDKFALRSSFEALWWPSLVFYWKTAVDCTRGPALQRPQESTQHHSSPDMSLLHWMSRKGLHRTVNRGRGWVEILKLFKVESVVGRPGTFSSIFAPTELTTSSFQISCRDPTKRVQTA